MAALIAFVKSVFDWLSKFLVDGFGQVRDFFWFSLRSIKNFFTAIWDFLSDGVYDLLVWVFKEFVEYSTLAYFKLLNWAIPFAWDVAKGILHDIGYFNFAVSVWNGLPQEIVAIATTLRLPEAITIIITAYITRFVLGFIPGIGK